MRLQGKTALITGATSGVGYATARILAGEGWREIIITGRSLADAQEAAAQLAAETKLQVFTPLELELDTPSSVQSILAELGKRGRSISYCSMQESWDVRNSSSLRQASRCLRPRSSAIIN